MYNLRFIDGEHKLNYERLQSLFPISFHSPEYQSACYISATPMLYDKFKHEIHNYNSPLQWILMYQNKFLPREDNESDESYDERTQLGIDFDLTYSMKQLGCLALNLFNGYKHFNLMDCLSSLDDKHVDVLKVAIDVRLGAYKGL